MNMQSILHWAAHYIYSKKPFNGDIFLARHIALLIAKYSIKTVVETGTYKGSTSYWLAAHASIVHTIEISPLLSKQAAIKCKNRKNILFHTGNSPVVLTSFIHTLNAPILYFLDAHWNAYWPLLDELDVIAKANNRNCVLVLHDAYVPGTTFGYDSYNGQRLDLAYVSDKLDLIYGKNKWVYSYNTQATGAKRGVLFVEPKL